VTLSRRRCRGRGLYTSINERVTDDDVSVHVEMSVQRVDLMATEADYLYKNLLTLDGRWPVSGQ